MKLLHTVTITGADVAVDVQRLIELSLEFPYVEWGILRSEKNYMAAPRYPSWQWRKSLTDRSYQWGRPNLRLALHLCGRLSRDVMAGDHSIVSTECGHYRRVQLNGWSKFRLPGLAVCMHGKDYPEFIAQATDHEVFTRTCEFIAEHRYKNVSVLHDASGGRGVATYDHPFVHGAKAGYAGGIDCDNVFEVLDRLSVNGDPFWIDLESGARTDDKFDLDKVWQILESCQSYVKDTELAKPKENSP